MNGEYVAVKLLNGWGVQLNIPSMRAAPEQKLFKRRCFSEDEAKLVADKLNNKLKTEKK